MPFVFVILLLIGALIGADTILSHPNSIAPTPTPIVYPTVVVTDTPFPTATPAPTVTQQSAYFGNALFCAQVFLQGATACADANKTPVACVNMTIPNPNTPVIVANFLCGIPGNSASIKPCIWYASNPNLISCR